MSADESPAKPSFEPANAAFEHVVRTSFASQGLMGALGARLTAVEPGRVTIELTFSDRIAQQHGRFHSGVIGAIAETAGSCAALSLMPAGSDVLTIEYKINFMRPARGNLLRATGQVVRAGKSVTVVRAEVETVDGEAVAASALMQATSIRVTIPQ